MTSIIGINTARDWLFTLFQFQNNLYQRYNLYTRPKEQLIVTCLINLATDCKNYKTTYMHTYPCTHTYITKVPNTRHLTIFNDCSAFKFAKFTFNNNYNFKCGIDSFDFLSALNGADAWQTYAWAPLVNNTQTDKEKRKQTEQHRNKNKQAAHF